MMRRSRARYLAPIALAAVVTATYLVVHDTLRHKHSSSHTSSQVTLPTTTSHPRPVRSPPKFYVVKPGDSLSLIAAKTKISIGSLEALNPNVDPNTLQTGQRLRLRR